MQIDLRNVASVANDIWAAQSDDVVFVYQSDTHLELQTGTEKITIEFKQPQDNQIIVDVHNGQGACVWQITATSDGVTFDVQGFNKDLWLWNKQNTVMRTTDVTKITDVVNMLYWELKNYSNFDNTMLAEFVADVVAGMSITDIL